MSVADCNGESVNTRFAFKFNGVLGLCAVDGNIFTAVLTAADTADFGLGVAANRVYMAVGVSIDSVGSYPAFPPLPEKRAVYLCCTFPKVTLGGR